MHPLLAKLLHRPKQMISKPVHEQTRLERAMHFLWDLSRHCAAQLRKDKAGQLAAAMTYHTLFSLLPMLVLMLVVAKVFVGETEMERFKTFLVDQALSGVLIESPPEDVPASMQELQAVYEQDAILFEDEFEIERDESLETLLSDVAAEEIANMTEQEQEAVEENIQEVLLSRDQYDSARVQLEQDIQIWLDKLQSIDFRSIGAAGVIMFIYGATALLATIERSFNQIYGGSNSRPWYLRLTMYYTTITLAPLVILAGQLMQQQALAWLGQVVWLKPIVSVLIVISPLLTIWLVFWLMYSMMPNARVKRSAAAIGALSSAILWVLAITGFRVYATSAGSANLYGVLALVPLFLLWVWITWIIILFGLEVSYAMQTMPVRGLADQSKLSDEARLFDPRSVVPIMAVLGVSFRHGKSLTNDEISDKLDLSDRMVAMVIDRLHGKRLVHRVYDDNDSYPHFSLARDPSHITVQELLNTGNQLTLSRITASDVPGSTFLRQLNDATADAAGQMTLSDLLPDIEPSNSAQPVKATMDTMPT